MRILWWSVLALLLCLAVTSALRNQTDITSRISRRLPNSNRNPISANKTENAVPTSRVQLSRRREENTFRNKPTVNVSRTRSRNKSTETSSRFTNLSEIQTERTEEYDSKKSYSRIRNRRPVIDESNFDTTLSKEKVKSRSRQTSRYTTPQTVNPTQSLVHISSFVETSAKTPIEITNYDDSSKSVKEVTNNQIKRRSSTLRTVETTPASRGRGRINKRTDIKPLDLEVSGTANALISAPREPTTVRNGEIRNSRKLRFRTRQSETDTNLKGEGITSIERKSSQTREHISSQSVLKKISRSSTENIVEQYTEKSTARTTKVIKRPVARRKAKNGVKVEKSKVSDEVSEDDNYPESFKAMIQARNASTHTSSPSSESLSVKASQKVFQTLTTTPQSFLTTPDVEKQTPLRNKLNTEDVKNNIQNDTIVIIETMTTAPEESLIKPTEYRLRGTYTPRIKKITSSSGPVIEKLIPSTQRSYAKFNRKTKIITTERSILENSPKTKYLENNIYNKKPVVRSSFYPKRNSTRNLNVNLEIPKINITERSSGIRTFNDYKSRQILPRTSYYSRLSSSTVNVVTTTELNAKYEKNVLVADKKMENTVEVPLIYTSINSPINTSLSLKSEKRQDDINYSHQPFIIKVNSKESSENGTDNELISKSQENENERATNVVTTTQKYHATYKDNNKVYVDENKENGVSSLHPPIRNIQTRKFSRKPIKQREEYSLVTPKYRDRNLRKYSDIFSKTTEASSNGIIAENDKPKSKFSSKYRASYLDKPFYKPTVPTITTSTVEGDGIQLGLDMNAISFTKTRSPLTSADLKLSESLAKPLQVMNVEASHHSPSVTVSIFDALAEILTSTTRPRISSTTEVQQNQNSNSDVKQTFDAVSSNINVNSVKDLTSQDTDISKDNVTTIDQYVQITEQTTPNVSNRMPFGGTITPSLNIEDNSVTTPEIFPFTTTTPSPFPTTPLSARRPFAIKVLYAETEPPRDITTKLSTLNTATTDNPQMMSSSALNIKDTSSLGKITTNMPPADKSTASHVLSLRTTTMLPSVDEILLNSISSATKEEMVISSMTSSTSEPRILTLDIDPETKQIRTEKPGDINGNAIFKFIPIDQVTVSDQESNVFKLGSTKSPITSTTDIQTSTIPSVTESNTQSQIQNSITNEDLMSTIQATTEMLSELKQSETTEPVSTNSESIIPQSMMTTPVQIQITTEEVTKVTSTLMTTYPTTVTAEPVTLSNSTPMPTTQAITSTQSSTNSPLSVTTALAEQNLETASSNQNEAELLQSLLREITRNPKNLNGFGISDRLTEISSEINNDQLLKSVLVDGAVKSKNLLNNAQTTTSRSIEDDIRQFEEDTKLLKALLQATGRNPAELNLPSLDDIKKKARGGTVTIPPTTTKITTTITPTTTFRTTTTSSPTTTTRPTTTLQSTTMSINEDIRKLQEDTKLLQALLQATRNKNIVNLPVISGITSNVRIASNPFTTSLESNPTTPVNIRPVYTTRPLPIITTLMPGTVTVSTLQSQQQSGDEFGISTTFRPFNERSTTTTRSIGDRSTTSRSAKSGQYIITTEIPSTSTFSDEEDLVFLQNLKSVLSTKTGNGDPETALANRVIALAVEKSLNEIQTGQVTTTNRPTMTSRTTTTTRRITTTTNSNTPSIEDDIKQFEQDTKLLQALLKATGQDPSKLNIPTLPPTNRPVAGIDLSKSGNPTTGNPYGLKIAVKDELKNEQDDAKLLQTLIKLQGAQETTTQRSKIALTGQSSDEALKKLLKQAHPAGMLSEATKSSVSLSTEYGNSNDALLAALLKEQGFGPTTASSLDEQLRLAALLNQVVVTPKARRTTTQPPPPPPSPRRPVLDGLAWLWQQWRETGPGPGAARPNRRPSSSEKPLSSSAETSSRVNWFGSGPFVGNADEKPSSNRIPLEPPSAVTEQGPGRGQLVSAAINVTRAFSQFLGAAIQGAAQTVQSVFKYGQRAATDTYTNGSG